MAVTNSAAASSGASSGSPSSACRSTAERSRRATQSTSSASVLPPGNTYAPPSTFELAMPAQQEDLDVLARIAQQHHGGGRGGRRFVADSRGLHAPRLADAHAWPYAPRHATFRRSHRLCAGARGALAARPRRRPRSAGACTTTTRRRSTACAGPVHRARRRVGRDPAARRGGRRLGRARPRRPHLQRRQDLPRAACRHRAGARPARCGRAASPSACPASASTTRTTARSPGTHLLQQTSEWEGTCFGMPDQVEHYRRGRARSRARRGGQKGERRPLQAPGTYWEYNDVRINQLSLALLHLFRRPLPEVFLEAVLRPLGGGAGFRWEGYDDAWVEHRRPAHAVGAGRHALGRRRLDQRARPGAHRQLLLDGGAHARPRAAARATGSRACSSPARSRRSTGGCVAQSATAAMFPDALAAQLVHGGRGRPLRVDRPGARRGGGGALDRPRARGLRARVAQALA